MMNSQSKSWKCFFATSVVIAGLYLPASAIKANTDTSPPVIIHNLMPAAGEGNGNTTISANVSDASAIKEVLLYLRIAGTEAFDSPRRMMPSSGDTLYSHALNPSDLVRPALEYYITAEDVAGNTQSRGFAFDPLKLDVIPVIAGNVPPVEQQASGRKISTVWYVVGGVLIAGLLASAGGSDSNGETEAENLTFTVRQ